VTSVDGRIARLYRGDGRLAVEEIEPGGEFWTLARTPLPDKDRFSSIAVHPSGRFFAAGNSTGVVFWELRTGSELGFVPLGYTQVTFEAGSGALWTNGGAGVWRWPVTAISDGFLLGPPQRWPKSAYVDSPVSVSHDGRTVAMPAGDGAFVTDATRSVLTTTRITSLQYVSSLAVSPDGRWLAMNSSGRPGTMVYDSKGETPAGLGGRPLGTTPYYRCAFSPDGRWLVTQNPNRHFWEVGTWKLAFTMDGNVPNAFSSDGKALAEIVEQRIRLIDLADRQVFAELDGPTRDIPDVVAFTPDGGQLIATDNGSPATVHVWDLRRIRRRLAEMGLDWNAPLAPAGVGAATQYLPLELKIDLGPELPRNLTIKPLLVQAYAQANAGKSRQAVASLRTALQTSPEDDEVLNTLAWMLLTGAPAMRDAAEALGLARRAVERAPERQEYRNTLGVALYRVGRTVEAIAELERSLAANEGRDDASDLFFLAMARHRLGDTSRARRDLDRAVRWLDAHTGQPAELKDFRSEAEAVLAGPPGELPVDVFAPVSIPSR
jgi:tetratricopeptide (TPR) repeat protein